MRRDFGCWGHRCGSDSAGGRVGPAMFGALSYSYMKKPRRSGAKVNVAERVLLAGSRSWLLIRSATRAIVDGRSRRVGRVSGCSV